MPDSQLYTTARLSPLSLTYYGLCLCNGNYTVKLHFAEILFSDDKSYSSLGKRIFDIYIQGLLYDGTIIAVKQLSSESKQGNREFVNEIGMISALQHPNLVKLYGCCMEGNQLLLVYEYMENNSLAGALFGLEERQLKLDWPTRHHICVGIARGLAYLHEESRGYMAPEYALRGFLTDKADVYSFGIVALEIVSGKSNTKYKQKEDGVYLLDWAYVLQERGSLIELVDPKLGSEFNKEEAIGMITIALLCTNSSSTLRPAMSTVVSMLEGRTDVQTHISEPNLSSDDLDIKDIRSHRQQIHSQEQNLSQSQSISIDRAQTVSSASTSDLYPIIMDSDF
ncbi:hypothetical protein AAC387_Pa12g2104 [Persea americana]